MDLPTLAVIANPSEQEPTTDSSVLIDHNRLDRVQRPGWNVEHRDTMSTDATRVAY